MSDVEFGNSLHEVCNELLAIPILTIQRLSFNIPNAASRLPLSMSHATAPVPAARPVAKQAVRR